ncbi:uncharacterized protein LOC128531343 isoform X2 [Clarias gariepinus]|uniref:uncharacterized protein LOC128531343 isoform X2 n=1 Tax=Clarias gariepinus TaxID=13013 RepID=UPI00234DF413|nr:uncharacterized protein LOC128531343 isoform X2 [Clarias gariepinus]
MKKNTIFWILFLITLYTLHPGRRWVTAQFHTEPPVYQPDEELTVGIGGSATLRCCVSENQIGIIELFKQQNKKKRQIIVTVYKTNKETFYSGFQETDYLIEKSSNCFSVTILHTIQSDEAMYYCALTKPNPVFANGTYLKVKGEHVTSTTATTSETSEPALYDHTVTSEPTVQQRNSSITPNINTQEKTVLGLGTALGLCVILILCLACFILRGKCDKHTSTENSPANRQVVIYESEAETQNYAALKFSTRNAKAEKREMDSDKCVYSKVKLNVLHGSP